MKFFPELRRLVAVAAIAAAVFLFTGCIQTEYLILVKKDGSGTLTLTTGITREWMEQLRKEGNRHTESTPETRREAGEQLAKRLGEGVKVVSIEEFKNERIEGGKIVLRFADITKLTLDTRDETIGKGDGAPETITFEFAGGDRAKLVARIHPRKPEPKTDVPEEVLNKNVAKILPGLKFTLRLQVDGTIVQTDAAHRDGPAGVLLVECRGEDLLKVREDVKTDTPVGLGWPWMAVARAFQHTPGVKVETKDAVTVEFQ